MCKVFITQKYSHKIKHHKKQIKIMQLQRGSKVSVVKLEYGFLLVFLFQYISQSTLLQHYFFVLQMDNMLKGNISLVTKAIFTLLMMKNAWWF